MAATRLVEHLAGAGLTDGGRGYDVTVVGEEPVPAYNRILLSAVLEGTHPHDALTLRDPGWYAARGVRLRLGTRVLEVDREARELHLVDGDRLPWDRLVLATGSIPTLPPVRGLVQVDGRLDPRVHAFRSVADCLGLLGALPGSTRAVVVGGGLLGLQVARALSVRGLATDLVEGADHVLHRQVGAAAGALLARELRRLGTEVCTGVRATRLTPDGVRLDTGRVLDADLVVLAAGGRPSTALARRAGLACRRGVLVDDRLTSSTDPRVHALGDCAEHGGLTSGFVGPAWDQAEVLAQVLVEEVGPTATATTTAATTTATAGPPGRAPAAYAGVRTVARLRATGLDVAVLGDPERAEGEVVEMTNPVTRSHRRLVVRDGRIVAAALVGDLSRVGLITQHHDQRTVLGPREPGELLLAETTAPPPALPDEAEVCACAGATAGAVRGCRSLAEARETTRATTGCGGCRGTVERLLGEDPGTRSHARNRSGTPLTRPLPSVATTATTRPASRSGKDLR
nr:FAD-dependent oxidoreductase [Nocardioides perillae]